MISSAMLLTLEIMILNVDIITESLKFLAEKLRIPNTNTKINTSINLEGNFDFITRFDNNEIRKDVIDYQKSEQYKTNLDIYTEWCVQSGIELGLKMQAEKVKELERENEILLRMK